jgi:hypothetical protein
MPAYDEQGRIHPITLVVSVFLGMALVVVFILGCWAGFGALGRWNRERSIATERKDITITASAEAEAQEARTISEVRQAERLAERDRIRAQGQADANEILQGTLTPEYLQWYWIETMRDSGASLIYVPMGADGLPTLPITEAGRAAQVPPAGDE